MENTSHTPGPWTMHDAAWVQVYNDETRTLIVERVGHNGIGRGEELANARLIAAAPEMLGHARLLALLFRNYQGGYITRAEFMSAMDDAVDFAEQAIDAATSAEASA